MIDESINSYNRVTGDIRTDGFYIKQNRHREPVGAGMLLEMFCA